MALAEVTLVGRHVRLEPLRADDVTALWPAAAEPEIWLYMGRLVHTPGDLAAWITDRLADKRAGTAMPFVQKDAVTGVPFGSTSLFDVDLVNRRGEIGHTWIDKSHRRTAANTEAKLLLLAFAFERLQLNRVQLKTDRLNERSQRAIERLGATREGVLRRHMMMPEGRVRDTVLYSVTDQDWGTVRRRLETLLARPSPGKP